MKRFSLSTNLFLLCTVGAWRAARSWCACCLGEPRARGSVMNCFEYRSSPPFHTSPHDSALQIFSCLPFRLAVAAYQACTARLFTCYPQRTLIQDFVGLRVTPTANPDILPLTNQTKKATPPTALACTDFLTTSWARRSVKWPVEASGRPFRASLVEVIRTIKRRCTACQTVRFLSRKEQRVKETGVKEKDKISPSGLLQVPRSQKQDSFEVLSQTVNAVFLWTSSLPASHPLLWQNTLSNDILWMLT